MSSALRKTKSSSTASPAHDLARTKHAKGTPARLIVSAPPNAHLPRRLRVRLKLDGFKPSSLASREMQTRSLLHALFPLVRAEVLRLLFMNPGQELYGRELARLSFLAAHTVQDELAKLEAADLVVSRSNGYQRFFRANPKHPLYTTLRRLVIKGSAESRPRTSARRTTTRR